MKTQSAQGHLDPNVANPSKRAGLEGLLFGGTKTRTPLFTSTIENPKLPIGLGE